LSSFYLAFAKREIILEVSEVFNSQFDGPHLQISVSTKTEFSCMNYKLEHEIEQTDEEIIIKIKEVKKPEGMCLTASGPAYFKYDAGLLKEGNYTLLLKKDFHSDEYKVKVLQDKVIVRSSLFFWSTFTKLKNKTIQRTPKNLLWATCFSPKKGEYDYDSVRIICSSFFKEIKNIALPYLKIEPGKTPKNRFYTYDSINDKDIIKIMQKFKKYNKYIYTNISTGEGKSFYCSPSNINCDYIGTANSPNIEIEYLKPLEDDFSFGI
jgi:hypothetical protein